MGNRVGKIGSFGLILVMAFAFAPAGWAQGQPEAQPLPDHFMGFKLGDRFDPVKLKIAPDLMREEPTGIGGTTGIWVHIFKKNGDSFDYDVAADPLPFPLGTQAGVKYRTRADITLLPNRTIHRISVIIRVPSDKYSNAAIEMSLMAAYGKFFSEKVGPYGTRLEFVFQDQETELKVGYADGGVELTVTLNRLKNPE